MQTKRPFGGSYIGRTRKKSESSSSSHGTMICSKIGPKLEGVWLMKSPRASGMFHYYDSVSILWNSPTVRGFFSSAAAAHAILLYPSGITPPPLPICFHERKKDGENIMALFFPRLFPGETGSGENYIFRTVTKWTSVRSTELTSSSPTCVI